MAIGSRDHHPSIRCWIPLFTGYGPTRQLATKRQRRFFLAGLATIALVVCTPIGVHASDLFWCHMIQHVTLMMVTGPLLVLGTPSTFHPKNKVFETFTNPWISWVLYASLMIGVHLPGPHAFIMDNPWVHTYVEIPLYITLAYFFYFNLLDRNLTNWRMTPAMSVISLFLMMVPETLTGFLSMLHQILSTTKCLLSTINAVAGRLCGLAE